MKTTTTYTTKSISPTSTQVLVGGKAIGTVIKVRNGYKVAGDNNPVPYSKMEKAIEHLLSTVKVEEKATKSAEKQAEARPEKEDPRAVFAVKVASWLTANYPEQADAWGPVFCRVLYSLRTRKESLKEVTEIEVVQAMLDFENETEKRSRMVMYLLKKVNGMARRNSTKRLTPAEQVAALLKGEGAILDTVQTAEKGEQPKQLTVTFRQTDGVVVTVQLTVREITAPEPEMEDDDADGDEEEVEVAPAAAEVVEEAPAPEPTTRKRGARNPAS